MFCKFGPRDLEIKDGVAVEWQHVGFVTRRTRVQIHTRIHTFASDSSYSIYVRYINLNYY